MYPADLHSNVNVFATEPQQIDTKSVITLNF